ncbi:MAG: hypothetical protein KJ667_04495 [Alphaproteobacteria bacterium]|nr:hypothetical protein [Alphaproteobacteria bacterium]
MDTNTDDIAALRHAALTAKSKDAFGETGMHPSAIWGVIMEVTYEDGTITVISMVDGSATLYVSTGGGITGAGEDEHIAGLSSTISSGGGTFFARYGKPVKTFPVPATDNVHFYFLSDAKVLKTDEFTEDELAEDKLPLSPLFQAMHVLISTMQEE